MSRLGQCDAYSWIIIVNHSHSLQQSTTVCDYNMFFLKGYHYKRWQQPKKPTSVNGVFSSLRHGVKLIQLYDGKMQAAEMPNQVIQRWFEFPGVCPRHLSRIFFGGRELHPRSPHIHINHSSTMAWMKRTGTQTSCYLFERTASWTRRADRPKSGLLSSSLQKPKMRCKKGHDFSKRFQPHWRDLADSIVNDLSCKSEWHLAGCWLAIYRYILVAVGGSWAIDPRISMIGSTGATPCHAPNRWSLLVGWLDPRRDVTEAQIADAVTLHKGVAGWKKMCCATASKS